MNENLKKRSVCLVFMDFEMHPKEVELLFGVSATSMGIKGSPVRPWIKTLFKRSSINFEVYFPENTLLVNMLPALFDHVGGVEKICQIKEIFKPNDTLVNFYLPVRNSLEQEDGYIEYADICSLKKIGANLAFGFL